MIESEHVVVNFACLRFNSECLTVNAVPTLFGWRDAFSESNFRMKHGRGTSITITAPPVFLRSLEGENIEFQVRRLRDLRARGCDIKFYARNGHLLKKSQLPEPLKTFAPAENAVTTQSDRSRALGS